MKLRLTDYNDNVNVPLFTYWLHDAEFKELADEARLIRRPETARL